MKRIIIPLKHNRWKSTCPVPRFESLHTLYVHVHCLNIFQSSYEWNRGESRLKLPSLCPRGKRRKRGAVKNRVPPFHDNKPFSVFINTVHSGERMIVVVPRHCYNTHACAPIAIKKGLQTLDFLYIFAHVVYRIYQGLP